VNNTIVLLAFWLMQVIAAVSFKYGSTAPSRWVLGFVVGNLFGASSIWLMMMLYKAWQPQVALGICVGGAFLLSQFAMALIFKSEISLLQYVGLVAITGGMVCLALGAKA
jgi:multidrug transporter EmrE-like cation transporter